MCPAHVPGLLFVSYSGVLGGAERVLLDCAAGLGERVILACPPGELAQRAAAEGLTLLRWPAGPLRLRAGLAGRARAARGLADHALALRRAARGLDPDLIVCWGMRSALAWRLGAAARPAVVAHHDLLPGPVVGIAVRAAAARAVAVIVPSRAVADDLCGRGRLADDLRGRGRLHIVTPGVDLDRFSPGGSPVSPPEVLVLGALEPWKRPGLALEIAALARRELPGLRLRLAGAPVAGDARLVEALRRRAAADDLAGAVELAGHSADPVTDLRRASCLLHCADREPFGLALVEALACGRPVVAPRAAGPREIIDADCGRLYPPGDAAGAAAALVELLGEAGALRRAGAAGRRRAQREFDVSATREGFAAAVRQAVRPRGGAGPRARAGDLTLVTVSHDSAPELATLLDSAARHLPGVRVIVVDCASADASLAVARDRSGVDVVELGENAGFGRGCNRGVARVATPATALVNPDVELIDSSLLALAAEALRGDRAQRLLAPRVLNGDGSLQQTVHAAPTSVADLVRAVVPPAAVPGRPGVALAPWRATAPRRVGWAVGCALVARTDTLRALGPFHEGTFLYGEDLDLGLHARGRGVETWLWPEARVVHRGGHAAVGAFGGEPFTRLARGRHDAVARRLGPRRAALDDAAQAVTFASRVALRRTLGRPALRERAQLAAVESLLRGRA